MSFLASLEKMAGTVTGVLSGGTIPLAVELGKDFLDLLEKSKTVVSTTDVPKLEAMRDELEPKVLAHADKTAATLRGE